jgi:hypothetical protein
MMSSRGSRLVVAMLAGFLVLAGSRAQAGGVTPTVRLDLTASAHPRVATAPVVDHAFHADSVASAKTDADATATSSAVCRGCSGHAVSVQVIYVDQSPAVKLDNVAIAWTQGCASCSATAVSLQVAIVSGSGPLTVTNRALALNAACAMCGATSGAYQLVLAGNGSSSLSPTTLSTLRDWASARARLIREPAASGVQLDQQQALNRIAQLVNADLGTTTVAARVRLSSR